MLARPRLTASHAAGDAASDRARQSTAAVRATVAVLVVALATLASTQAGAATWIVEAGCDPPNEDCDCSEIQPCIDAAAPGDTVLVRAGTYTQQSMRTVDIAGAPIDITANVFMRDGVHLVGDGLGFRDPPAILDGGAAGICIFAQDIAAGTMVDNLTIRNGRADGAAGSWNSVGGGLLCVTSSPTVRNCVFDGNFASGQGGGMYCEISSSPAIEFNLFVANSAAREGGALACLGGEPEIRHNTFSANDAVNGGGAIRFLSAGYIADNVFEFNQATSNQADIALGAGAATGPTLLMERNVFYSNSGAIWATTNPTTTLTQNTCVIGRTGIAVGATTDAIEIFNNIVVSCEVAGISIDPQLVQNLSFECNDVWDSVANYDLLPDQTGTGSNISADPLHCDPAGMDFTLAENSPCTATNSPCGNQIGVFGANCPPSAVETTTWGAIKSSYR